MARLFTFGCSFTGYWYPTWADILIAEAQTKGITGLNYGRSGAGNLYISMRIWEAHAKYKFTQDDTVLVCWSGFNREDRYTQKQGWITPGNLVTQNTYQSWFIEHYHDMRFCAMRDCATISSTQLALRQLGVHFLDWTMAPILQNDEYQAFQTFQEQIDVIETYDLKFDAMPMMEYIGTMIQTPETAMTRLQVKYDGYEPNAEWHPTPQEHLDYLENNIVDKLPWLNGRIMSRGRDLADEWQNKLTSFNGPVPIAKLGWQSSKSNKEW